MYPKAYIDYFRRFEKRSEVFVAMPMSPEFQARWRRIYTPAITTVRLRPYRADVRRVSDSILTEILEGIGRAKFILVDASNEQSDDGISSPNPNVMYELGLAHAMRLPEEVIVVRGDKASDAPFDIRHIRWTRFDPDNVKTSVNLIARLITEAERELELTRDLIVEKTLASLDPDMIWFLDTVRYLKTFDLYPFDLDRKGLYELACRETTEAELRAIARELIVLGILEGRNPGHPAEGVYGGRTEYALTSLAAAVLTKIKPMQDDVLGAPAKKKMKKVERRWRRRSRPAIS